VLSFQLVNKKEHEYDSNEHSVGEQKYKKIRRDIAQLGHSYLFYLFVRRY
jgi:hypothetical protein